MPVTPLNWNTTHYKSSNLKAFISVGADPENPEEILFLINLTDEDHREFFQQEFKSLEEACACLNERWGDWQLSDLSASSGCGTCAAH